MSMAATRPIAPISRRVIAYLVDGAIIGVISGIGFGVALAPLLTASSADQLAAALVGTALVSLLVSLVVLAWALVMTAMQGGSGSVGMRLMKLQLVRADTGEKLGFGRALLRNIIFGLTATIIVGYFSPLFDGSGRFQGWHDKAGNALMLDMRGATPASAPGGAPVAPGAHGSASQDPAAPIVPGAPATTADPASRAHSDGFPASAPFPAPAPIPGSTPISPATNTPAPRTPTAATESAPVAPHFTAPVSEGDDLIAFVPGITVTSPPQPRAAEPANEAAAMPVAPAPSSPIAPAPAEPVLVSGSATPEASDHDDDIESTRISVPGHRMIFTWDDGTRIAVSGRTIFGRNPSQEIGAIAVPVRDETLSLSKTHFEAAAEPNGAWVMDRFSTNGVTVVRDGVRIACPPGTRVPIRLGDAIEIGDRIVTVGGYV